MRVGNRELAVFPLDEMKVLMLYLSLNKNALKFEPDQS